MNNLQKVKILNGYVNSITFDILCMEISKWIKEKKGYYVIVSAVHASVEAYKNQLFAKAYNGADIVLPDGRPLFWALKFLGYKDSEHLRGEFITRNVCKYATENNFEIGFYGAKKDSLDECINVLKKNNIGLKVNYNYSPQSPFTDLLKNKDYELINQINSSNTKILFVALGCPVQELWMEMYKKDLNCVCIGIGAAIDFISGKKLTAPLWIQNIGLEWFLRVISEPRRLFWRYLSTNLLFIYLFIKQCLKIKL